MNVNTSDDESPLPSSFSEVESARKKMRADNSSSKSWRLMDRKTDHEVLQEMGVSLLEPDDSENIVCDPNASGMAPKQLKRKHMDIENVNPNVNSITSPRIITSPRSKYSPKSPRVKPCSPNAGPSRLKSAEKLTPLQPTDQRILETTLLEDYLIDEETPLAQSVSAGYLPTPAAQYSGATSDSSGGKHRYTPLGHEDELIISRRHKAEPVGTVSFNILSDEMILSVFRWLPKRTLAHCMMVCKRWHRVACDETLWQRLDLGNKTLSKDAIGRILARKPVIVRLASSEIGEWHPATLPEASRIHYLDLSMATIDVRTLNNLLQSCPSLKKLSLESVQLEDSSCELIGKCSNLETLNLTMALGVTADGLKSVLEGCKNLLSLNISWCTLTEAALEVLVTTAPQRLQRLNIGGARIMTDDIIDRLVSRCPRLLELDVSDCGRLTARCALALTALQRLEHLALSRCYLLPAHALTAAAAGTPGAEPLLSSTSTCAHVSTLHHSIQSLLELDVSDCGRLTARCALALTALQRLEHLALSRCYLLPAHALTAAAAGTPGAEPLLSSTSTCAHVSTLHHSIQSLLELDVSDCGRLTARCALALTALQRLEHLALSRCYLLPAHALTKLGSMPSLQYVDVWGMLHSHALTALRAALPHVQINTFMFSAIARPTVGTRRTSIWGLRTRD
ncbi:hypothetical protein PYW07_012882 [Mythimna separata]|uniref:F-box domain-containing protein n=1 Tax=Mythimna separata TaxID=271217 RepID=A0AAD8DKY7_MYTSE|nr:hypothetical protein PYW07_012882 [Mythimna separata]